MELYISLITDGATEKVLQFMIPLKSVYNKNFGFIQKNYLLKNYRKVKTIKMSIMALFLKLKKSLLITLSELPL
jgi:hypothetical protein